MDNDLAKQIGALRPALMRQACRRVGNRAWAEDAVSETLLAALEKPSAFGGRAQLQTWLVGVLKHKLVDQMRRGTREASLSGDDDTDALISGWADTTPQWGVDSGAGRADPQDQLMRQQFVQQLERGIAALPAKQGRAFVLRDCHEGETDDVCQELGVTANHLAVMLHRARYSLRGALQGHWTPAPRAAAQQGVRT